MDIYDIGAELGISRASVDSALQEISPSHPLEMPRRLTVSGALRSIPISFAAFATGGILASLVRILPTTGFVAFGALLSTLGGAVALATLYKGFAKHERFQFANIALWVGFMIPLAVVGGAGYGPMLEGLAPYVVMSGIAGSVVISVRGFVARVGGPKSDELGNSASFSTRALRAIRAASKAWKSHMLLAYRSA
jgi:hypothetical protein